jgi:hypothetical protein
MEDPSIASTNVVDEVYLLNRSESFIGCW